MSRRETDRTWVGVISDTHGLLRPEAVEALQGVSHIVHAGDIGRPEIVDRLAAIAPVTAVRGNVDREPWARRFSETELADVAGRRILVLHDLHRMVLDPAARGIAVVVSGHSHKPGIEEREGVLYLNPGSAGPRRFTLPVTVALLQLSDAGAQAEIVELAV